MVIMTEYEKAIEFLKVGCSCGCSSKFPRKRLPRCARLFKLFPSLFLMAQLKVMDGGSISASRRLKKKVRVNKRTLYC